MANEIFVQRDYSSEFDLSRMNLVIPEPKFGELRLPKLSESTSIDKQVKDELMQLAHMKASYDPELQKNPFDTMNDFVYIVGADAESRNSVAAAFLNYINDLVDYRNHVSKKSPLSLHRVHIDAHQTLAEEIATDVLGEDRTVQKLIPLDFPEPQRVGYLKKVQEAEKLMRSRAGLYAMVLPDIDEIISNGLGQGWTCIGRRVLETFEYLERDNCLTIGTLKPDNLLIYGNRQQAGLNKTCNLIVEVPKK